MKRLLAETLVDLYHDDIMVEGLARTIDKMLGSPMQKRRVRKALITKANHIDPVLGKYRREGSNIARKLRRTVTDLEMANAHMSKTNATLDDTNDRLRQMRALKPGQKLKKRTSELGSKYQYPKEILMRDKASRYDRYVDSIDGEENSKPLPLFGRKVKK